MFRRYGILLFAAIHLFADSEEVPRDESSVLHESTFVREFLPNITQEAATREWGKFSFSRSTGFNAHTSPFAGSLNITALPRFEIGTSPIFYAAKEHTFNLNTKFFFYNGERWHWALSYTLMGFSLKSEDSTPIKYKYNQSSLSLLVNYFSPWWDLNFSAVGSSVYAIITGDNNTIPTIGSKQEWGVDVSKVLNEKYFLTLGFGQLRDKGYTPFEETPWNLGASVGIKFPNAFLSRPSTGFLYVPQTGRWQFLFSTTFY